MAVVREHREEFRSGKARRQEGDVEGVKGGEGQGFCLLHGRSQAGQQCRYRRAHVDQICKSLRSKSNPAFKTFSILTSNEIHIEKLTNPYLLKVIKYSFHSFCAV